MSDTRPTYRIPAREVVPGMLFQWVDAAHQITEVERLDGGIVLWWGQTGKRLGIDGVVTVQLLGPSPRELACDCWQSQERTELSGVHPRLHAPGCPVSPVPGRHGGMRLWPAPFISRDEGAQPWRCKQDEHVWMSPHPDVYVPWLRGERMEPSYEVHRPPDDVILQCFYLPPEPQPESRETPAWDPYGTDLDLAVRYG